MVLDNLRFRERNLTVDLELLLILGAPTFVLTALRVVAGLACRVYSCTTDDVLRAMLANRLLLLLVLYLIRPRGVLGLL